MKGPLLTEVGQSFYLMGLMAAMVCFYVGVGLLAGKALVIDATVGSGGHAEALLEAGVGAVVGLDRDPEAIQETSSRLARFGPRFRALRARFSQIHEVATQAGTSHVGGVLYDLGLSSMQLDRPERGFSYRSSGPLDMRMGQDSEPRLTAERIVNTYSEEDLARILFEYGEERLSRRIARAIGRAGRSRVPTSWWPSWPAPSPGGGALRILPGGRSRLSASRSTGNSRNSPPPFLRQRASSSPPVVWWPSHITRSRTASSNASSQATTRSQC